MGCIIKGCKVTIKCIMPPIITYIIRSMFMLIRKLPSSKVTLKRFYKRNNGLIILGNGPSLEGSLASLEKICGYDVVAVNGFAATDSYEKIRPNMYVLADPAYFNNIDDLQQSDRDNVMLHEGSIVNKTKWNLSLFVPSYGEKSDFISSVKDNSFIKVFYYNMYDCFIPIGKAMKFYLWDKNINALAAQTVLNTCLNLGIILRYDEIYLVGADTSWHENLRVEQENNKLYLLNKHFYGEEKLYLYTDANERVSMRLDKELSNVAKALSLYWELKEYADSRNVRVFNASEYSNIDAFPRKKWN